MFCFKLICLFFIIPARNAIHSLSLSLSLSLTHQLITTPTPTRKNTHLGTHTNTFYQFFALHSAANNFSLTHKQKHSLSFCLPHTFTHTHTYTHALSLSHSDSVFSTATAQFFVIRTEVGDKSFVSTQIALEQNKFESKVFSAKNWSFRTSELLNWMNCHLWKIQQTLEKTFWLVIACH